MTLTAGGRTPFYGGWGRPARRCQNSALPIQRYYLLGTETGLQRRGRLRPQTLRPKILPNVDT